MLHSREKIYRILIFVRVINSLCTATNTKLSYQIQISFLEDKLLIVTLAIFIYHTKLETNQHLYFECPTFSQIFNKLLVITTDMNINFATIIYNYFKQSDLCNKLATMF